MFKDHGQNNSNQVVICANCKGEGTATYGEIDNEGRYPRTYYHKRTCKTCEGTGRRRMIVTYETLQVESIR